MLDDRRFVVAERAQRFAVSAARNCQCRSPSFLPRINFKPSHAPPVRCKGQVRPATRRGTEKPFNSILGINNPMSEAFAGLLRLGMKASGSEAAFRWSCRSRLRTGCPFWHKVSDAAGQRCVRCWVTNGLKLSDRQSARLPLALTHRTAIRGFPAKPV